MDMADMVVYHMEATDMVAATIHHKKKKRIMIKRIMYNNNHRVMVLITDMVAKANTAMVVMVKVDTAMEGTVMAAMVAKADTVVKENTAMVGIVMVAIAMVAMVIMDTADMTATTYQRMKLTIKLIALLC